MSNQNHHFSRDLLVRESLLVFNAGDKYAAQLAKRLLAGYVAEGRALIPLVTAAQAAQQEKKAGAGTLTLAQNSAIPVMKEKMAAARKVAKKVFAGDTVKLHDEFQIGGEKSGKQSLADELGRARIILASCRKTGNAAAMAALGWIEDDNKALEDAIKLLTDTDATQETAKAVGVGATGELDTVALDLFTHVDTIQTAANLQFPESDPANKAIREEFRLGIFPPPEPNRNPPTIPKRLTATPGAPGSHQIAVTCHIDGRTDGCIFRTRNKSTGEDLGTLSSPNSSSATLTFPADKAGLQVEITATASNEFGESKPAGPII